MNNYHPNIILAIEINPKMFLHTQVITKNRKKETSFYKKSTKLPVPRSSNIPKHYKRNAINADLHRSKRISTNFDKIVYRIKKKFLAADYPQKLVESFIRNFENDIVESIEDDYIIPPEFFDIAKRIIILEVPLCTKNEVSSKQFM